MQVPFSCSNHHPLSNSPSYRLSNHVNKKREFFCQKLSLISRIGEDILGRIGGRSGAHMIKFGVVSGQGLLWCRNFYFVAARKAKTSWERMAENTG